MAIEPIGNGMTMGERMMLARRRAELEQSDVAEALDISRALVSRWERDQSIPRADKLEAFAHLTGVPLMFFYGDDSDLKGGAEITPRIPDRFENNSSAPYDGSSPLGVVGQQSFTFSPLPPRPPSRHSHHKRVA